MIDHPFASPLLLLLTILLRSSSSLPPSRFLTLALTIIIVISGLPKSERGPTFSFLLPLLSICSCFSLRHFRATVLTAETSVCGIVVKVDHKDCGHILSHLIHLELCSQLT